VVGGGSPQGVRGARGQGSSKTEKGFDISQIPFQIL